MTRWAEQKARRIRRTFESRSEEFAGELTRKEIVRLVADELSVEPREVWNVVAEDAMRVERAH